MNKKQYIDERIRENKERINNLKNNCKRMQYILMIAGIIAGVGALCAVGVSFGAAAAAAGAAAGAFIGHSSAEKNTKYEIDRLNKESHHLEKLKTIEIDRSEQANNQRNTELSRLRGEQSGREDSIKNDKIRDNYCYMGLGATTLLGIAVGGVLGALSPLVAGFKYLSDRATSEKIEKYNTLQAQINMLEDERAVIACSTPRTTTAPTRTPVRRPSPRQRGKRIEYTPEQVQAVNDYVEQLSRAEENIEKPKTIVKK